MSQFHHIPSPQMKKPVTKILALGLFHDQAE